MRPPELAAIRPHLEQAVRDIESYLTWLEEREKVERELSALYDLMAADKAPPEVKGQAKVALTPEQYAALQWRTAGGEPITDEQREAILDGVLPGQPMSDEGWAAHQLAWRGGWRESSRQAAVWLRNAGETVAADGIDWALIGLHDEPRDATERSGYRDAMRMAAEHVRKILTTYLAGGELIAVSGGVVAGVSFVPRPSLSKVVAMASGTDTSTAGRSERGDVPEFVIERARANEPVFSADEVAVWPAGILDQLVADGVLQATSNATSVTCDACGHDHVETVQYVESRPGAGLRAYISCPENGRVSVPLDGLRRWMVNREKLPESQEPVAPGAFQLPDNVVIESTFTTEFLPTPAANDPKGLRDAATYCRGMAAKLGDVRAKWWWNQARVFDIDAAEAERRIDSATELSEQELARGDPETGLAGDEGFDLSSTKRLILRAILDLKAVDTQHKASCPEIATQVKMDPDTRLRGELAGLRALKLLGGSKGQRGYWLTPAGIREARRA